MNPIVPREVSMTMSCPDSQHVTLPILTRTLDPFDLMQIAGVQKQHAHIEKLHKIGVHLDRRL